MDSNLISQEEKGIHCSIPGPNTKAVAYGKGSWRHTHTHRVRETHTHTQTERGKNTKLKEIKTMLCKIVTAVSVFIGCFFWLHFFSNCGSYEQEGIQHGQAAWWWEE